MLAIDNHFLPRKSPALDVGEGEDWVETTVLGKSQRNRFESISKSTECVLLNCLDAVRLLGNCDGAGDL